MTGDVNRKGGPGRPDLPDGVFEELLRSALDGPELTSRQMEALKAAVLTVPKRRLVWPGMWLVFFPIASLALSAVAVFLLVRIGVPMGALALAAGSGFGALVSLPQAVGAPALVPLVVAASLLDFGLVRWLHREGAR